MLQPEDQLTLEAKGISEDQLNAMLNRFEKGFPYLTIIDAARPSNGITVLSPEQEEKACLRWHKYLSDGGDVCKFVPASGAASRMFPRSWHTQCAAATGAVPCPGGPAAF